MKIRLEKKSKYKRRMGKNRLTGNSKTSRKGVNGEMNDIEKKSKVSNQLNQSFTIIKRIVKVRKLNR